MHTLEEIILLFLIKKGSRVSNDYSLLNIASRIYKIYDFRVARQSLLEKKLIYCSHTEKGIDTYLLSSEGSTVLDEHYNDFMTRLNKKYENKDIISSLEYK